MKHTLSLVIFSCLPLLATAANDAHTWHICHLQVQALTHGSAPHRALQAKVLQVRAQPADSDCPVPGQTITFDPETADYQGMLAYKRWPKVGQKFKMRYLYLDGMCKNDGNEKPCRIAHHPVP